jgi:prepilin-type N-terminal cleavage/methylation domain-containing protein
LVELRASARRGFTLVELLVVVGIVAILSGMLVVGVRRRAIAGARRVATLSLLRSIENALAQYSAEFREFPPDGFDQEPAWGAATKTCHATGPSGIALPTANGPALYSGSGCLVYFLCHPISNTTDVAGRASTRSVGPYLHLPRESFSASRWDPTFDPAIPPSSPGYKLAWSCCEIVDAEGLPIHYDKVRDPSDPSFAVYFDANRFAGANGVASHSDQTFVASIPTLGSTDDEACSTEGDGSHVGLAGPRHSDPRSRPAPDGCFLDGPAVGPRGVGYDLWAHGRSFSNARTALR